jgi:thiocyanate desulfurase
VVLEPSQLSGALGRLRRRAPGARSRLLAGRAALHDEEQHPAEQHGLFDTSDPDPRQWKKITFVKDAAWTGEFPGPFHLCFSIDGSKMFVSVPYPKPHKSGCCVVDTKTWKIIKKFHNIGPDCQPMSVTYDGKYVFQIFSGFQRLSAGVFVYRQDTLDPVGYLPNFGGHHDCVIVPTRVEHLRNSRCTTL